MKNFTSKILITSFLLTFSLEIFSQSLYKVTSEEKIDKSSLIVEGKVIAQKSFWNAQHSMIYTSNTIEIYKIFKGISAAGSIEILTMGGQVNNNIVMVSEVLEVQKNDVGVFFLYPNQMRLISPETGNILFDVYSSLQGFLKYDLYKQTAAAPFVQYNSIENDLYKELQEKTGKPYESKQPSFKIADVAPHQNMKMAAIASFSPAIVAAGAILDPANNVLTINGSAFGVGSGTAAVLFKNSDNGGATDIAIQWDDPLVVSWTDTRIDIRVPSRAGTGIFSVRDAGGVVSASATPLDVMYGVMQGYVTFGPTTFAKEFRLANYNGSGGYTILYNNNINGTASQATFQRALTTWKEIEGYNITEAGNTATSAVADDGFNVIMLDNAGTTNPPLAAGVLGVCYSYFGICGGATSADQVFKSGFDIVIRQPGFSTGATAFTIGPCPPLSSNFSEIDLETVILHELGHSLNLTHIIDPYKGGTIGQIDPARLMNFNVVNSVRRTSPDYAARAGADYTIANRSITFGGCIAGEMARLIRTLEAKDDCPLSFPTTALIPNTSVAFDLVHTTSNRYVDPSYTQVRCDGLGTPITNNAYYAFKTNNVGGSLGLSVTNYSTTPAALSGCTQVYGGIPVTGVRMALYQANSCPTSQAFPAPIACTLFTANGALPNITGLAANTTYLIYLGGVENTKANFTLTFTGSSLPVSISDFTGEVLDNYNQLNWQIDYAKDVTAIYLEKSANGSEFERIGEFTGSLAGRKGIFKDSRPYVPNNYYRLQIINQDGTQEYSKVVLLKRKETILVNVFPNPAHKTVNVEINSELPGKYQIKLQNTLGQQLVSKKVSVMGLSQKVTLRIDHLLPGFYQVVVFDEKTKLIKSTSIRIE